MSRLKAIYTRIYIYIYYIYENVFICKRPCHREPDWHACPVATAPHRTNASSLTTRDEHEDFSFRLFSRVLRLNNAFVRQTLSSRPIVVLPQTPTRRLSVARTFRRYFVYVAALSLYIHYRLVFAFHFSFFFFYYFQRLNVTRVTFWSRLVIRSLS